jgi:DNA-binding response OmpR family regulator/HPt (histidine-containing phosphotransfer) domain-containing protein
MDEDLDFDDPETVMREARARFIEAFPGRVRSISMLFETLTSESGAGDAASSATARRLTHQMAGIAGTLGFPSVSEKASALEQLVIATTAAQARVAAVDVERAVAALVDSFGIDMQKPEPAWAKTPEKTTGPRVLLVEDDDAQRQVVASWLRGAGYQVTAISNGGDAFARARVDRPALVVLDIDLPGVDGHAICRKLKSSPDLANTPVVFMTTRATMTDRLTGVALGADDYLIKPIEQPELILRLKLLLGSRAQAPPAPDSDGLFTYEAFAFAAQEILKTKPAALALLRLPRDQEADAAKAIAAASRQTDIVAMLDATHAVWLLPEATDVVARTRVAQVAKQWPGVAGGVAATTAPGARSLEAVLAEADQQLNRPPADASVQAEPVPRSTFVLLADDDPAVMRIVDAQLKSAGYRTQMVFDGVAAAAAVAEKQPDVLLLDLMMPKRTGFDVLAEIGQHAKRPRVIVLSARGREEDVTRAFSLGADDYMTKPFSPQELLARVARLVR